MSSLFQGLKRAHIYTLFGFASIGGLLTAGMIRIYVSHLRSKVKSRPYYQSAMDSLNRNPQALEVIGKPIKIDYVDFSEESNKFTPNEAFFKIPVRGSKLSGHLVVDSFRVDTDSEWILNTVKFTADDKTFIIYRLKNKES